MRLLEYPISNPYPKQRRFTIILIILLLLLFPFLVLINIVTSGYQLVPALRMDFGSNDTVPEWMSLPYLPPLLRRKAPSCQPKDFGRGDILRLTPSLFQYKVLSAWRDASARDPEDETRIEYRGASFKSCYVYGARLEHSLVDWTQSVTTAIYCPETPVNAFLETTIVFADDINKDQLGEYYGEYTNLFKFINISSRNYRKAVFGVLDVISTDSLMIVSGQHLSSPLLSLSVSLNVTKNYEASRTYITYVNGTVDAHYDSSMGPAQIYRDSIYNLVVATAHAVNLDLGNASPNIFLDPSIIHDTLVPNLPPPQISPQDWVRDSKSFYYGRVVPPYQTWAQMLLAGQPQNLTLGNLTELPPDSKIVSNYLCPSYQPKPMSSFLASVFIGTATMYLSVWGTWAFVTKLVATRIRKPCLQCTFGDHTKHGDHGSNGHGDNPTTPDQPTEPAAPPQGSGANSARSGVYKDKKGDHEDEAPIQELPKADPELALGEPKNRG